MPVRFRLGAPKMKSKEKGDIAVAKAISYYMQTGYEVLLPIGDKRPYDLVFEDTQGILIKVQCKYTSHKSEYGIYQVPLRVMGGNRSYNTAKSYDKKDFDILFVYTSDRSMYAIPFKDITAKNSISLGELYLKYKIMEN